MQMSMGKGNMSASARPRKGYNRSRRCVLCRCRKRTYLWKEAQRGGGDWKPSRCLGHHIIGECVSEIPSGRIWYYIRLNKKAGMKAAHVCGRISVSFLFYVPIFNSVSITASISRVYPTMLTSVE